MACCNNECLETVYTDCVEHVGTLTVLPNNLGEIITAIDEFMAEDSSNSEDTISIDLKCLSSNCGNPIPYSYTYVKPTSGTGNALLKINPTNPVTGAVTIKAYYSGTVISSINNVEDFLIIPLSYANLGFTVTVELVYSAVYYGTFYVSMSAASGVVNNLELQCQGSGVVEISKINFYNLVVDKLCELSAG